MATTVPAQLAKIQRVSAIVRGICNFLQFMVAIGAVLGVLALVLRFDVSLRLPGIEVAIAAATPAIRALAIGTLLVGTGIVVKILRDLRTLFALYADGKIFTEENVRKLRH